MASEDWHLQKQQAGVMCPLRQVLFFKMVEELVQRTSALRVENKDDALCTNLRSKLILTEDNAWNYMAWDTSAKCLRPTKQEPLSGDRIREILTLLTRLGAQTELIHRFSPLRPLDKNGIPEDSQLTIPWRLDISLGSLMALCDNGIGQMILLRIRPATLQRSQLAQAVAHRVRR